MTTSRFLTADDLWNLPQDHLRHELVRGELTTKPLCDALHGQCAALILMYVAKFVEGAELGTCFAGGTGFLIGRDPDTVLAPDFAFINNNRLPLKSLLKRYCPVAPDLVVEVLSPSDSAGEIIERTNAWLTADARLVWVVDPETKTVTAFAPNRQPARLRDVDTLYGDDVLPGFQVAVAEIFH